jgi:phenylalanyl-tRNA synthetase beta chain
VRLEFRAGDRTLTDDEIAPQRNKIVEAVKTKLEGELRG